MRGIGVVCSGHAARRVIAPCGPLALWVEHNIAAAIGIEAVGKHAAFGFHQVLTLAGCVVGISQAETGGIHDRAQATVGVVGPGIHPGPIVQERAAVRIVVNSCNTASVRIMPAS